MKPIRPQKTSCNFQPLSRLGRVVSDNLSWGVDRTGQRTQMYDRDGFVFDLDRQGRIIRMRAPAGKVFKCG